MHGLGLPRCTGRRTGVKQEKCGRNPVGGRAACTGVGPLRGRHDGTIAATMSTGAQIRWRIMPLTTDGQIGKSDWEVLSGLMAGGSLLVHHSHAGVYVS